MKELEAIVESPLKMKLPLPVELLGATGLNCRLPSYLPDYSVGISTMSQFPVPGCRGFIGPVPPPLWIEVPFRAIEL
jgi:hypothetical protein